MVTDRSQAEANTIRVLLIEDNEADVQTVSAMLRSSEVLYHLEQAPTLQQGEERLKNTDPDLVILDLGLPDAAGLESLSLLERWVTRVPFVLLTGRNEEALALAALRLGAEDYLVKGETSRSAILRALRYAVERHGSLRAQARKSSALAQRNESLEHLVQTDPLTEVLNRRGIQTALNREANEMRRDGRDVLVLVIDVDDFKRVNDRYGLAAGDSALRNIARRLREQSRTGDYVGRIGGDEFLMVLPRVDRGELEQIAERVRVAVGTDPISHGEETLRVTVSIAALLLESETPAIDELLARAHQLLRRSKSHGKNRSSFEPGVFEEEHCESDLHRLMCENLARGRHLATVRQPIMRLSDGSIIGWEFLSRYSDGRGERPDHFFRVCTEENVLTLVDHQCLRSASRQAPRIKGRNRLHFNLFPATLSAIPVDHLLEGFPERSDDLIYCIEISERHIQGDPMPLVEPIRALKKAGFQIAVEDVGFGTSRLESLVLLEPDIIKLDRKLSIDLEPDDERLPQIRWYRNLARTLGLELFAEGIETETALNILREIGVGYGQGFLWGEPT